MRYAISANDTKGSYPCVTAMNIFANAVVITRSIPFEIKARKENLVDGLTAFYTLREEAKKNGVQDMTLEEINEEIRKARAERKQKR